MSVEAVSVEAVSVEMGGRMERGTTGDMTGGQAEREYAVDRTPHVHMQWTPYQYVVGRPPRAPHPRDKG